METTISGLEFRVFLVFGNHGMEHLSYSPEAQNCLTTLYYMDFGPKFLQV